MRITYFWKTSGIYKITNMVNGKVYIGSASDLGHRWSCHLSLVKMKTHPNVHLRRAIEKHGLEQFTFEVVEIVQDKSALIEREQFWIDGCRAKGELYNIALSAGSTRGVIPSPESIERQRKKMMGKKHSLETRARMSRALMGNVRWLGKKHSAESKDLCRIAKIGNKFAVGERNGSAKLNSDSVREIRVEISSGIRQEDIARRHGVSQTIVSAIKRGQVWGHVA